MYVCPKCNGEMIQTYVEAPIFNLRKTPSKFLSSIASDILSCVCSECGYIEFYAKQPDLFKQE